MQPSVNNMAKNQLLEITLHNWRCFELAKFGVPTNQPLIVVDSNGAGKTSLLSAVYSLLTGSPWVQTSPKDHLMSGKEYFGITTQNQDWSYTGKIGPSGRLGVKYENGGLLDVEFGKNGGDNLDKVKNKIPSKVLTKVLTYLPTDNYWFGQTRSKKLSILDGLLGQISTNYQQKRLLLDKFLKSKLFLIKKCQEFGTTSQDMISLNTINSKIDELSQFLWAYRIVYLSYVQSRLHVYLSWLENHNLNIHLTFEVATSKYVNRKKLDLAGIDVKFDVKNFEEIVADLHQKIVQDNLLDLENQFEQKTWESEVRSGKVLWGAGRDEFGVVVGGNPAQNMLSRGEMRLLVLFFKSMASELINLNAENNAENNTKNRVSIIWLLDDVFNELDGERENFLMHEILEGADWFMATSTRSMGKNLANKDLVQGLEKSLDELIIK